MCDTPNPWLSDVLREPNSGRLRGNGGVLTGQGYCGEQDDNQTDFKNRHSNETALLFVTKSMRQMKAGSRSFIHILLDAVNHPILLSTHSTMGIKGTVLSWFKSYRSGRSFKVTWNGGLSKSHQLLTLVLQGSVLGPNLFSIYTTSVGPIIQTHGFSYQCYADDTPLYFSFLPDDPTMTARILACLADILAWIKEHQFNSAYRRPTSSSFQLTLLLSITSPFSWVHLQ
ncbi:uncharacterized protein LOC127661019 [Xyrauchen texanus]|uniref:uncharacterized protein LOC127661019 n=1 Tax=Xyrauchen texanus TaxID=154827 RepID=UPI00224218E8|nr:uncharacterized protein LOC127661019 [Xyrauchen texanus]XP_052007519.1 uncharacterized protein LOC127661019 [Xyrauchen texanus]